MSSSLNFLGLFLFIDFSPFLQDFLFFLNWTPNIRILYLGSGFCYISLNNFRQFMAQI